MTKILADSRAAEGRLIKLHDEIVRIGKTDASYVLCRGDNNFTRI